MAVQPLSTPTPVVRAKRRGTKPGTNRVQTIILHILLGIGALVMVIPFLWMLLTSLKTTEQAFMIPPKWIPNPIVWSNYPKSLQALPFGRAYFNSFYIAAIIVTVSLLTASMAAYAFAKIRFPGHELVFLLFLATLMVPQQVTIIPLYLIMKQIGWLDTHLALIVPSSLFNAFAVFMLRQFIRAIPKELEEAAIVDGANRLRTYWSVILPLLVPALSALGIFLFLGTWNDYFRPLIFLSSIEKYTVPLTLDQFKGQYTVDWTLLMAGSAIATIPVLIVYLIGQRKIIEGITLTGLTGR